MTLFPERFDEKFIIEPLDRGIFMADAQIVALIDFIQRLHARTSRVDVCADRLASTVDASAGAGHYFDELKIFAARYDFFQ